MTGTPVLVWDASALHHAAVADRVDVLAHLAQPWRNVTTAAVLEELGTHGLRDTVLGPDWLEDHRLDGLDALPLLLHWTERLGAGQHHRGEVTVAVASELIHGTALLDDSAATGVLRTHGVEAHGTVWLAAQAVVAGRRHTTVHSLTASAVRVGLSSYGQTVTPTPTWAVYAVSFGTPLAALAGVLIGHALIRRRGRRRPHQSAKPARDG